MRARWLLWVAGCALVWAAGDSPNATSACADEWPGPTCDLTLSPSRFFQRHPRRERRRRRPADWPYSPRDFARGDESPDLSATFFSNEDSSDSGDVPIRMSGSLPDIPAETLFKGSVLEDDGFFDEDDFEDVGNGEDVADLFA